MSYNNIADQITGDEFSLLVNLKNRKDLATLQNDKKELKKIKLETKNTIKKIFDTEVKEKTFKRSMSDPHYKRPDIKDETPTCNSDSLYIESKLVNKENINDDINMGLTVELILNNNDVIKLNNVKNININNKCVVNTKSKKSKTLSSVTIVPK